MQGDPAGLLFLSIPTVFWIYGMIDAVGVPKERTSPSEEEKKGPAIVYRKAYGNPVKVGETIPEVADHLSMTLLWWTESNVAVNGPYSSGDYYTFTAKPNMKFVILAYRFQNNGVRPQETPYLDEGEIQTDKGYFYPVWSPPHGANSTEYKPRRATTEEVNSLIGDSGGYEKLLPEESVVGAIVFEIPADQSPVEAKIAEAKIARVPAHIEFREERAAEPVEKAKERVKILRGDSKTASAETSKSLRSRPIPREASDTFLDPRKRPSRKRVPGGWAQEVEPAR